MPNSKGFITSETIYKAELDPVIRQILKPILNKIENEKLKYDENEFFIEIEQVFKLLNPGDKAALLKTNKKSTEINEKSPVSPVRSGSANVRKQIRSALTFSSFSIKSVN